MLSRIHLILLFPLILGACSTPQKSRIAATSAAFAIGLGVGASTAPANERQDLHAIYWGGILGVATAIASEYYFADDRESEKLKLENEKLKAEMDLINNANKVMLKQGKGYLKNPVGEENVQGGKAQWRMYQVDRWNKDGPTRMYHEDRMVELLPEKSDK